MLKGTAHMLGCLHSHLSNTTGTGVLEVLDAYWDHEMGNKPFSAGTPLECVLRSWERFDPQTVKEKSMKFCVFLLPGLASVTPGGQRSWPPEESIQYSAILQLALYCRRDDGWSEVPYVQVFFALRDQAD